MRARRVVDGECVRALRANVRDRVGIRLARTIPEKGDDDARDGERESPRPRGRPRARAHAASVPRASARRRMPARRRVWMMC
jgi:hypothetical protein